MRSCKLLLVISFLCFALIFFPISSASQNSSLYEQFDFNRVPLPPLQFNNLQEKIVINNELRVGSVPSNSQTLMESAAAQSSSNQENTIPSGAIIYHENNATTIFSAAGNQLFSADDNQAAMIHTYEGDSPATFVHEVPSNSTIIFAGNTLHVMYEGNRILTIIRNTSGSSPESQNDNSPIAIQSSGGGTGVACNFGTDDSTFFDSSTPYIEGIDTFPNMIASPSQFSATWNVPASPVGNPGTWAGPGRSSNAKPITIWIGMYGCPQQTPQYSRLIQPVLEWYVSDALDSDIPTTAQWTESVWFAWHDPEITVNGVPHVTFIHSPRKSGIQPGEQIRGEIWIDPVDADARGTITDISPSSTVGGTTQALTAYTPEGDTTVPVRMLTQNLYATAMMEGWTESYNGYHSLDLQIISPAT